MVTLTCSYEMTARSLRWEALERTSTVCGTPRRIGQQTLRGRDSAVVPTAGNANDVVVATFDYPRSAIDGLATFLFKPSGVPVVVTNGHRNVFVAGTASQFHLLRRRRWSATGTSSTAGSTSEVCRSRMPTAL